MNNRSEDSKKDQSVTRTEEKKDEEKAVESKEWADDEVKLLVKGCKLIAVGTRNR